MRGLREWGVQAWLRRGWRRRHAWIVGALMVATTLIAYWPSFRSPFQFDDFNDIATPQFARLTPRQIIARYPTRWIPYLTLLANAHLPRVQWHGWRPVAIVWFHIGNWAAHIGVALLLYLLTLRIIYLLQRRRVRSVQLLSARGGALVTALLFALHPMLAQTVIYLSQRATLLMAVCYLGTLLCVVRAQAIARRRWWLWFCALICLGLGAGCKETIVSAPFSALWLWWLLRISRVRMRSVRQILGVSALIVAIVAIPAIIFLHLSRWHVPTIVQNLRAIGGPLSAHTPGLTRATYAITQVTVIGRYLRLAVWPAGLAIDHDVPLMTSVWQWPVLAWGTLLLALALLAWHWRRTVPLFAWGYGFFLIALLPQSSLMPTPDLMLEYRTYPALAGVAWMGLGLYGKFGRVCTPRLRRWLARMVMGVVLIAFGVLTWQRSRIWRSDVTLWYDAWRGAPTKQRVVNNLANALLQRNRSDLALALVQQAISSTTNVIPHLLATLGNIYATQGDLSAATNAYVIALSHDWSNREARYNLSLVYARMGLRQAAIDQLRWLCHVYPTYADAWLLLGVLCAEPPTNISLATNALTRFLTLMPEGPEASTARALLVHLASSSQPTKRVH